MLGDRNVNFLATRIINKCRKNNVLDSCRKIIEKGTSAVSSVFVFQDILVLEGKDLGQTGVEDISI